METDYGPETNVSRREIRVLLLDEFRINHRATEGTNNICSTMGEGVVSVRTAQHWFNRFKNDNFELDDLPRSGRPRPRSKNLVHIVPNLTRIVRESEGIVQVRTLGFFDLGWKYGVWIPHELSPHQLQHRVDACMDLTTSHRNHAWLLNLVTGDEKWVLYVNYARSRQWLGVGQTGTAKPKPDLHPKEGMLERLVECQRCYSLGTFSQWLYHHC